MFSSHFIIIILGGEDDLIWSGIAGSVTVVSADKKVEAA